MTVQEFIDELSKYKPDAPVKMEAWNPNTQQWMACEPGIIDGEYRLANIYVEGGVIVSYDSVGAVPVERSEKPRRKSKTPTTGDAVAGANKTQVVS